MKFLTTKFARILFVIPPLIFGMIYVLAGLSGLDISGGESLSLIFFLIGFILIGSGMATLLKRWVRIASIVLAVILVLLAIIISLALTIPPPIDYDIPWPIIIFIDLVAMALSLIHI